MPNDHDIEEVLRTINDPELGIDIVSLGLIYRVAVEEDAADILMTMTTPYCPLDKFFAKHIPEQVQKRYPALRAVRVRFTFDPPWTQARIHPDARLALGLPSRPPGER